jgi:DNA-binding protein H-NS
MATLEAIQSKIAALQAKADAIASKETTKVVAQIRAIMEKHGLTIADLEVRLGDKRRGRPPASGKAANVASKTKGKLPPKYMNPKTGETWSGHARPPGWIAGVKDRAKFLIAGNTAVKSEKAGATANTARKNVGGTAAKTKGKMPPKYRDPKTGATWSGHARPPQWIAGVKDRSKFLIAGAAQATA